MVIQCVTVAVAWRLALAVWGVAAHYFMPPGSHVNWSLTHRGWPATPLNLVVDAGVRVDSFWYARIVLHGYSYSTHHLSTIGFFPLYPALIKLVTLIAGNVYSDGMMVSTICLLGAVALFAVWLNDRGLGRLALPATALLLGFPFAFF